MSDVTVDLSISLARAARGASGSAGAPSMWLPSVPAAVAPLPGPDPVVDAALDAVPTLDGVPAPAWEPAPERDYLAEAVAAALPDPDYAPPAAEAEEPEFAVPDLADVAGALPYVDPLPGASLGAFEAFSDLTGAQAGPEAAPSEEADPETVAALLAGFDPARYLASSPAPAGAAATPMSTDPPGAQVPSDEMTQAEPGDGVEVDVEAHTGPRTPEDVLSMLRELNSLKDQR